MRRSELGEFIAPKHKITEFSEVRAGFRPALPRIPQELLRSIIGFFRSQMESGTEFEALVRIYWDRKIRSSFRSCRSSASPRIVSRSG